jgi:hypothetical protein
LTNYKHPKTTIDGRTGIYRSYVIYINRMYYYFETAGLEHEIYHRHITDQSAAGLIEKMYATISPSKPVQSTQQISIISRQAEIEINDVVQKIHNLAPCEENRRIYSNATTIWQLANASNLQNVGNIFSTKFNNRWRKQKFEYTWSNKITDGSSLSGFVLRFDGKEVTIFIKCIFGGHRNVKIFYICIHKKPTHAVFTRNPTPSRESGPAAHSAGGP